MYFQQVPLFNLLSNETIEAIFWGRAHGSIIVEIHELKELFAIIDILESIAYYDCNNFKNLQQWSSFC